MQVVHDPSENVSDVIEFSTRLKGERLFQKCPESVGVSCRRSDAIVIRGIERLTSYWRPSERRLCIHTFARQETRCAKWASRVCAVRVCSLWKSDGGGKAKKRNAAKSPRTSVSCGSRRRIEKPSPGIRLNAIFNGTVIVVNNKVLFIDMIAHEHFTLRAAQQVILWKCLN